jgi:protein-tyrosine phosphatase
MATELHWISGPWPGKLALAARPRGGDWLEDEIGHWHHSGVDTVLSLLSPDEEQTLGLGDEADAVRAQDMDFISLPIPDRQVPGSETELAAVLERVNGELSAGKNVLVHCRQGVGRTGLVAACLLISRGLDPTAAVETVSAARGVAVPETKEQRQWIDHYAAISTSTK